MSDITIKHMLPYSDKIWKCVKTPKCCPGLDKIVTHFNSPRSLYLVKSLRKKKSSYIQQVPLVLHCHLID